MSENNYIHLSHNVSNHVYHIVCPAKYRRVVFEANVEEHLKQICVGIETRYDYIRFLEIVMDRDQVHFLVQSTPHYSVYQIVKAVKSITARSIFAECPEVKKKLWGGQFWTDRYYASTVGKNQNETVIKEYVKQQGKQDAEYKELYLSLSMNRPWKWSDKIRRRNVQWTFRVLTRGSLLEMRSRRDVNDKIACLFNNKCKTPMSIDQKKKILDSVFYETDINQIGDKDEDKEKRQRQ